jgi:hypothetical protein
MSVSRSWLKRARRALTSHVDRLQDTLTIVTERLRDTVAQAVSTNLANAIREAVHALFSDTEPARAPPSYYEQAPYRSRPTWGEPDRYDRAENDDLPTEDWSGEPSRGWREVDCEAPEPKMSHSEQQHPARLHHALAIGCQAAAWWLRRQVSRASAFAALGIGLVATGAAFVAGIGLAESALNLLGLADAMRSGVRGLAYLA